MSPATSPWLLRRAPRDDARARLFCLPFAGGSASAYRDWHERLPTWLEVLPVELPGHGMRLGEPPIPQLLPLVEAMLLGLAPWMDRPFALFGHSMGALLAFEATRLLRSRRAQLPFLLAASGYRAPHLPDPETPIGQLAADDMLARLARLGGMPPEVLRSQELLQLLVPVFRADFNVTDAWRSPAEPPLVVPMLILGGLHDPRAPRPALAAWAEHAAGPLAITLFPGDHFYHRSTPAPVLQRLREALTRHGPAPSTVGTP